MPDTTLLGRLLPTWPTRQRMYNLSETVPWQPMPDPIETYPPSRTTASVTKGWRIADLNYFLSQQIVIVPLLWSLMPSQEQSRCMRWPMGYLEAMRQDVLHACSHGIYCFKKHLPTLPSSAIPNRSFLTSFLYAPFVG